MREELKQEKAINEHIRDDLKQLEARKDERLRELAAELGSVNAKNKGLEGELQGVKDLVEQQKEAISHLTHELNRKDEDMRKILYEQETANNSKISELIATIEEKEQAIATLQAQSQQQLQLTLPFITDSLDPAVTSQESEVISQQSTVNSEESEVSSQQSTVTSQEREVSRGELIEYIRQRFPKAKIHPQNITDAINGKSKRMPEYESTYGFKYVGKKAGQQHRFIILSQG